jgi:L-lactate dehydrogenase (cytochrome)
MPVITTIQDLKNIYQRRVPRMFYDYCESGSWTEQTFEDNISDFAKLRLRQRVAIDMTNRSTASKMIGQDVSMPVALAPVGMTGMQCADGEIKAARAARRFRGALYIVDHVDLFHRRCCRRNGRPLLVSALHFDR